MLKAEKSRYEAIAKLGCIVCLTHYKIRSAACIHHLLGIKYRAMGKKANWQHSIGLCPTHHQYGTPDMPGVHSHPAEFKRRYGSQEELLELQNMLLGGIHD